MQYKEAFLPRLSVRRPVTVVMIFLALLVTGAISYNLIPVELFPVGFDPPFLGIWVSYRSSNPAENEEQIARPAEELLRTVRDIKEIYTFSNPNGIWFWLEFRQNANMDLAYSQVSDRIERARLEWPDDQRYVWINRYSDADEPVYFFGITFDDGYEDPYYLVENRIKKRLERVSGVAKVETWGTYQKIIQVEIDADRVKAYKLSAYQIINDLRNDNFAISSGYVKEGAKKYYLRSLGQFKSLEDIKKIPVNNSSLRLQDVARVTYDIPERRYYQRINREPSAMVAVFKESNANTVETCKKLGKELDNIKGEKIFAGMKFSILFNQAEHILETVEDLQTTGLWGGLFALCVLFFFLRRFWMTSIITLAIPLSLLISLMVLYFMGWSLNIMTMMGLMISVGLVIDNSIVVVENIQIRKLSGINPVPAAIGGASEVSMAVTLATLTTVVVFLPLIVINDDVGFKFYMMRIGFPVIFALLASLGVSLLFIPLAAKFAATKKIAEPPIINRFRDRFQRMLRWVLLHRVDATLIALVLLFSIVIPFNGVEKTDEAEGNINDFRLRFDIPNSYTIEKSNELYSLVEELLFSKQEEYDIRTVSTRFSTTWGQIRVFLNPHKSTWWLEVYKKVVYGLGLKEKKTMDRDEVIEDIKERFPDIPGVTMFTSWRHSSTSENTVEIQLSGYDTNKLLEIASEVERILRRIPEINSVDIDIEKGKDEISILLDQQKVRQAGLNPSEVAYTISYAIRGYELPEMRNGEKEITVRTQYLKEDRETLEQLKNMRFTAQSGDEVPLSAIADFKIRKGLGEIRRKNGRTSLNVQASTTKGNLDRLSKSIDKAMSNLSLPRGYSWDKGARFFDWEESNEAFMYALILAVLFVFLLMGVLFESFVLPLSVIISIFFAPVGAFWLLFATGTPLDIMGWIGLIILVGVVVNNAIVLIDLTNRLREDGFSRNEALMEASKRRFRPIMMTALTTIFGLAPMALGNSSLIGIPYAPLGRVIIGGLITSTIFTLIFVPLFYTFFDDLREFWKRVFSTALRTKLHS